MLAFICYLKLPEEGAVVELISESHYVTVNTRGRPIQKYDPRERIKLAGDDTHTHARARGSNFFFLLKKRLQNQHLNKRFIIFQ